MPRPCFHKLILSSTIRDKRLRIPEDFVQKIRDKLSAVARLVVPDGHAWHVGLRKADNNFWLQDGWHEFVVHYSIRAGHFLIFRYEGNSAFSVYIYNLNTSEINYQSAPLSSTQGTNYGNQIRVFEEMEDDDYAEVLVPSTPTLASGLQNKSFGDEWNLHLARASNDLREERQSIQAVTDPSSGTELKKPVKKVKLQNLPDGIHKIKKRGRKKKKSDSPNQQPSAQSREEVGLRYRFYESASARKRTVTAEERERVLNAAKAFEPANPFCRVVLRPSYLYKGCIMYLPSGFAEKNLNGVSGFIKLQISNGRQWSVRCVYKGGRAKLSQGWYEFTLENLLGEGDVCILELLNMKEIVLKVTMFRIHLHREVSAISN